MQVRRVQSWAEFRDAIEHILQKPRGSDVRPAKESISGTRMPPRPMPGHKDCKAYLRSNLEIIHGAAYKIRRAARNGLGGDVDD